MTTQVTERATEYKAPQVSSNSGPPRAIYLAPVYRFEGKRRLHVGERLTSFENPMPADPRDEARYLRKGFKIASKADIERLGPLEGHMQLYDEPLDAAAGDVDVNETKARYWENKAKEAEQKLALIEDEKRAALERKQAIMAEVRARKKSAKPTAEV